MTKLALSIVAVAIMLTSLGCAGRQKQASTVGYAGNDGYVYSTEEVPDYVVIESDEGVSASIEGEDATVIVEPEPWTVAEQVPPERPATVIVVQPPRPYAGAIWVDGYWRYGNAGFVWVAGHYVPPRAGYVFVAPRWVFRAGHYHHFPGYYRPRTAYVRTYFSHRHYYRPHPRPYYESPPRRHHYGRVSYHGRVGAPSGRHGYPQRPTQAPVRRSAPAQRLPRTVSARPQPNRSARAVPPVSRPSAQRPRVAPPVSRPSAQRPRVAPPSSRPTGERPRVVPPAPRSVAERRTPPPARAGVPPRAERGRQSSAGASRGTGSSRQGQQAPARTAPPVSRSQPRPDWGHSHSSSAGAARGGSRAFFRPAPATPPVRARPPSRPTAARSGGRGRP